MSRLGIAVDDMFHDDATSVPGAGDLADGDPAAELEARRSRHGLARRNTEDRNDGHDRDGELDPGLEFVRPGPRARRTIILIISKKTTSCPPGPATVGAFPTTIPIITAGSITESTCRWGRTARPSITFPRYFAVPPEQMFIQTYYNPFETRGQAVYSLHAERGATIRRGARPWLRRPCR